jgi:site-specific DNA-cytosine methylase
VGDTAMKLLELFSGTKSISKVFEANGWQTFTVDNDPTTNPDLCIDVAQLTAEMIIERFGYPDVIWASPPCTTFSVASIGTHWTGGKGAYIPKTKAAEEGAWLAFITRSIIEELRPDVYFIENPRGLLRKMPFMQDLPRYTVTYCQYGDTRMKPTDIWTNHPNPGFKPMCKNGDTCHERAPRGAKTGTQGLANARERGRIPEALCRHICEICSEDQAAYREVAVTEEASA